MHQAAKTGPKQQRTAAQAEVGEKVGITAVGAVVGITSGGAPRFPSED